MKIRNFIFIMVLLVVASCTNSYTKESANANKLGSSNNYRNMTVDELNQQLKNKEFALVDVHIPEQKHINGTDTFIPYDDIENQLDKLPSDKNAKIVLYCRTGHMSQIAAEKLAQRGQTDVYNVVGGIVEWVKKGYKV